MDACTPDPARKAPSALPRRGLVLVLAAASGGGKTTVLQALLDGDPGLRRAITVTTRAPRPGEVDGVDYYFRTDEQFAALLASGGLLEHATVFGRSYGTPRAPIEEALAQGTDVAIIVDWQGHRAFREQLPGDVLGVFLLPPSLDELERRLVGRGDRPEQVASRMAEARSECSHWPEFDHVVVNDDLGATVAAVRASLSAARTAASRQLGVDEFLGLGAAPEAPSPRR